MGRLVWLWHRFWCLFGLCTCLTLVINGRGRYGFACRVCRRIEWCDCRDCIDLPKGLS